MSRFILILAPAFGIVSMISCDCHHQASASGSVAFAPFHRNSKQYNNGNERAVPAFALISIIDDNGNRIAYRTTISLKNVRTPWLTESLRLTTGKYQLIEFLVFDKNGKAIGVTPNENSSAAEFISDPLPLLFSISISDNTRVITQILPVAADRNPSDFGYTTFYSTTKGPIIYMPSTHRINNY